MKKNLDKVAENIPSAEHGFLMTSKRMLAYQIGREMAQQGITRVAMAERMKTSRAQLNRLLDPENPSTTLQTIENAAKVLELSVTISLKKDPKNSV